MDLLKNTNIEEDIVKINSSYSNFEEAIIDTANMMKEKGYVKESFIEAVIEREKIFPTGLPLEKIGVAIPHTDVEHVNKQSIAINVLSKPVKFITMATENEEVEVSLIIMLAIKEEKHQVLFLQSLMGLFQDSETMDKLISSNDAKKIVEIFKNKINEVRL